MKKTTKTYKQAPLSLAEQEKEAARVYSKMSSSTTGSGVLLHDVTFASETFKAGTEVQVVGFACFGPSFGQPIVMLEGQLRVIRMNHLMVRV